MNTTKLLLAFLVSMCGLVVAVPAQSRRGRRVERDVRISKQQPTIYITFEGIGREREIWLRLHNNTRWRLELPTVAMYWGMDFVPYRLTDEYRLAGRGKGAVAKPRYHVEERGGAPVSTSQTDRPFGAYVSPGRTVLFNVSEEHLSEGRKIYLTFRYEWEHGQGYERARDPVHRAEFDSSQLPVNRR